MDLNLLTKLQNDDTVILMLRERSADILDYFIVSRSIVCDVLCVGVCEGTIPTDMLTFNIRLSSISALLRRGYRFLVSYSMGELKFTTPDGKLTVTPLYVETEDKEALAVVKKYSNLNEELQKDKEREDRREELMEKLRLLRGKFSSISLMHLGGGPPDDPFTEDEAWKTIEQKYTDEIKRYESLIAETNRDASAVRDLNLKAFIDIALAASRSHGVVDMCGSYAILELDSCYMLQKSECPVQSIQGQLLYSLLRDGDGLGFLQYNKDLVYIKGNPKTEEKTVVMISSYLPSSVVDDTIVTKGSVQERYEVRLKDILVAVNIVKSQFPDLVFNMGMARAELSNELGEQIQLKFEVVDSDTVQLRKMKRGETVNITMANISIPKQVQGILSLFRGKITIYVKEKKVIFQAGTLYLIFGR